MEIPVDESRMKQCFKEAFFEVLEERKDVLNELIAEVMEDIALGHAIQERENTKPVNKQKVLKLLDESKCLSDTC